MPSLPEIPGQRLLAELRTDRFCRWYRVDAPQPGLLVAFHDAQAGGVAQLEAVAAALATPGFAAVRASGLWQGLPWFVLAADTGEDPLRIAPLGELAGLNLLRRTAASLHAAALGDGHGGLLQGGLTLLPGPAALILPAFVVDDWLAEQVDAPARCEVPPGYRGLSASGRDLAALAAFACHWIAGARPAAAAGISALPPSLARVASPATVALVRTLLKVAGDRPSRADAKALLARLVQVQDPEPVSRAPVRTAPPGPVQRAGGGGRERPEPRQRPAPARPRRVPAVLGVAAVAAILLAVIALGGGGAIRSFLSDRPEHEPLPSPADPMAATADAVTPERPVAESSPTTEVHDAERDAAAAQIAERVLQQLRDKHAAPVKPVARPTVDKSAIDEGGRLKAEAMEILRAVRDHEVKHEDRNRRLDEAIGLLEKAQESYQKFIDQYPAKESLVEGTMADVIAMLRLAYKSKTRS